MLLAHHALHLEVAADVVLLEDLATRRSISAAPRSRARAPDQALVQLPRAASVAAASWRCRRAPWCSVSSVLQTQMMGQTSIEGNGGWKTYQRSRGPSRARGLGRSQTSSQSGVWVWIHLRNCASSWRERGITVTKRPPARSMCSMLSCEHSLESAT